MSASPTSTGAVLGAATTAGFLASGVTSATTAVCIALAFLLFGFFLILFYRRKRKDEQR